MRNAIGNSFLVTSKADGEIEKMKQLTRLPFEDSFEEAWLQKVLEAQPALLPIESVDARVQTPLTSIGREIGTPAGAIDNLFISQNGYLVVVEAKLWRNPEQRRTVVAQILDYAKDLRHWTYTQIQDAWREQAPGNRSLWAHVQPAGYSEDEWVDKVNDNLSSGSMALLIVGDGIRSEVHQLAEAVSKGQPDFQYCLGMVELRLFRLDDLNVIVVPVTTAKTLEIEHAIVRIELVGEAKTAVKTEITVPTEAEAKPSMIFDRDDFLVEFRKQNQGGPSDEESLKKLFSFLGASSLVLEWGELCGIGCRVDSMPNLFIYMGGIRASAGLDLWVPTMEARLRKVIADEDARQAVVDDHVHRLIQLGVKTYGDKGKAVRADLGVLRGKERALVECFEQTCRMIQEKAAASALVRE